MTPHLSLDKKAQRVQRKVLRALHVSISCFSFSHTFHSRLLKASSEQVSIIIAVSVAFGFYELRAVCAVFRAQVRRVDPYTHKISGRQF